MLQQPEVYIWNDHQAKLLKDGDIPCEINQQPTPNKHSNNVGTGRNV
jgi:hypothetical protein